VDRKITVLHLRASNFLGGPEKQILEHGLRIDKNSFEFLLCPFREGDKVSELEDKGRSMGLSVIPLPASSSFSPLAVTRLIKILRNNSVHLLCTHGYKPNVVGQIASRVTRTKVIAFSRGWTYENRKVNFYESLDRFFIRFAHHLVAVSEGHQMELLRLGIKPDRISVIHNAVNSSKANAQAEISLRSILGVNPKSRVVVSAGRLSPEKNFSGLIDAAVLIRKEDPTTVFAIFGEGVLRKELAARIEASGLKDGFFLPGFRRDFTALLHEADLFVLPSLTEGLPNVILEAYAAEKAVVATDVGGNPEVVRDGETGFLVPAGNVAVLSEKILFLLKNQEVLITMGKAGYQKVKSEFSFESQTQKLEAVYNEVLKEF
jgi:glycosyltransferase involved in cell wall biosynthesis